MCNDFRCRKEEKIGRGWKKEAKMDREENLHSKFKQVSHLDTAGVWGGQHVDALRVSELPGWSLDRAP